MVYTHFKKKLIAEFEMKRDILVAQTDECRLESLFAIKDKSDDLYIKILDWFDKIAIRNVECLVEELCEAKGIDYGRDVMSTCSYDMEIEIDGEKKKIEFKARPNSMDSNGIDRMLQRMKLDDVPVMMVFLLKGMIGVISKTHQDSGIAHVDSTSFMFYSGIFTVLICSVWHFVIERKLPLLKGKSLLFSAGDGVLNGVGDLLLLIAVAELPASVQYPLVTGGVMVFSTIISVIRREKVAKLEYIAAAVALAASVMMAF